MAARSRAVTLASLLILSLIGWAYLLTGAGMDSMAGMAVMEPGWPLTFAMWAAMMVAMMVPSAAPAILLYARVHRHSIGSGQQPPTAVFLAGYLLCWIGFSALAATSQIKLESDVLTSRSAAAALLIAAGIYQLTPLKDACLGRCRSPAGFITRHYRPRASGALRLGLLHGAYCVGCCWLLMALLFVGGVMDLLWIAGLTLLIAAEKLLSGGVWIARFSGVVMIGGGAAILIWP